MPNDDQPTNLDKIIAALAECEHQWFERQLRVFAESSGIDTSAADWQSDAITRAAVEHLRSLSKRPRGRPKKLGPNSDDYEFGMIVDACEAFVRKKRVRITDYRFGRFVAEYMRDKGMHPPAADGMRKRIKAWRKAKQELNAALKKTDDK